MPERQFLFSIVFCFKKVVLEIFSEFDATKAKVPILPRSTRSPEGGQSGPVGWPHHRAVPPWPRHHVVGGPWVPTDIALPPIN